MRKILSALMILTLLVLFSATYYNSVRIEKIYTAQLQQLNQLYAGFLSAELVDYRRGLLVSEVETNLLIQGASVPLQQQIRHFPWMVRIETRLAEGSEIRTRLAAATGAEPLTLLTEVQLDGSSQTSFQLAELALSEDRLTLLVQGVKLRAELDNRLAGKLVIALDRLEFAEQGKLGGELSELLLDSDFLAQQGLPLGRGTVSVGKIAITPEEQDGFTLNRLHYAVNTELADEKLATDLDLSFASLLLGGETFSAAQINLRLSEIDAQVIRELQVAARQLQADLQNKQVDPLILQLQLLGFYSQLLQKGLNISLHELALEADGGYLQGTGELQLQGLDLLGGGLNALQNLDGELRLSVDQALFKAGFRMLDSLRHSGRKRNPAVLNEQAEQLAGGLVQKGIFTRPEAGRYQLDVSLRNGKGRLNGTPFNF